MNGILLIFPIVQNDNMQRNSQGIRTIRFKVNTLNNSTTEIISACNKV